MERSTLAAMKKQGKTVSPPTF